MFAGSFQYLNNTKKVFNFINKIKPKLILIEGITLFSNFKKKRFLVKQLNELPNENFCFFYDKDFFIKKICKSKYKLIFLKRNPYKKISYSNFNNYLNKVDFYDILFKKIN